MRASDMLRGTDDRELDDVMTQPEPKSVKAKRELLAAGCVFEKREDASGETKAGWWQDGVWLGERWDYALEALKG